jgi:site-specific recombinase XerD
MNDELLISFNEFLDKGSISKGSLRNYRSDINLFLSWLFQKLDSIGTHISKISESIPFLNESIVNDYITLLRQKKLPAPSINRRLSSLRHFSKFLVVRQITVSDFMEGIGNVGIEKSNRPNYQPLIDKYSRFLTGSQLSPNSRRNYVSDARGFVSWLGKRV